jgi:uncharacterized protein (DUF4415 family)
MTKTASKPLVRPRGSSSTSSTHRLAEGAVSPRLDELTEASESDIVRYSLLTLPPRGRTDWERLERMTDDEIEAAVRDDPDAAPITDEDFWRDATLVLPPPKEAISINVDQDVVAWFRSLGRDHKLLMNRALRGYMELHNDRTEDEG